VFKTAILLKLAIMIPFFFGSTPTAPHARRRHHP
jgi:hypothetical protein